MTSYIFDHDGMTDEQNNSYNPVPYQYLLYRSNSLHLSDGIPVARKTIAQIIDCVTVDETDMSGRMTGVRRRTPLWSQNYP